MVMEIWPRPQSGYGAKAAPFQSLAEALRGKKPPGRSRLRARRQSGARRKHCTTGTPIIAGARRKPAISDPDYQIQTSQQTAESRPLAAMGAEVILHPTLTDTVGRDVKLVIARASAAMNQVYFFDINGVGDGGIGRTTVVDP